MSANLQELLENIKDGETCLIGGGKIDIFPEHATSADRFYPGYGDKRNYAFVIKNKKNITIDGQGADLIFHGAISPFWITNCENVTLKNFTLDYAVPGYVCGKVTNVTEDYYDLDFSAGEFCADVDENGSLHFFDPNGEREAFIRYTIIDELDGETHIPLYNRYFLRLDPFEPGALLSHMFRMTSFEKVGENVIRVHVQLDLTHENRHKVGNYIMFDIAGRNNVNFQFDRCTNVHLENIDMYASLGLAIITTNCKNLYFKSVNSVTRKNSGRILAVKDDVFHLVATKGEVVAENCILENMKDDALNIHSFYPTIIERIDANSVIVEIICPQDKIMDFYNNGQKLMLLNSDMTDTGLIYTVKEHAYVSDKQIKLTFEESLAEAVCAGSLFDDSHNAATLLVRNCKIANTLGRIVVQTPAKAVVENCSFKTVGSAITVNGRSKTYSESAPVSELIIKNNHFCGMGARPDILTATGCYNPENKIIHGKIVIESNDFTSCDGGYIALKYFDTVIIKNNTFKQNPSYVPRWQKAHIQTNFCNTITID